MTQPAVFYLMTGPSHLHNLVVSLVSLRRHFHGPVYVAAWGECPEAPITYRLVKQICADERIRAEPIHINPPDYRGKNAQEIGKIKYLQDGLPALENPVVYLDADTIICKPLTPLIDAVNLSPVHFVATQFADWKMRRGVARGRVERLLGIDGIDQDAVKKSLQPHEFSLNSGVFACRTDSPALPVWGEWTEAAKHIFISGECAQHPLAQKFPIYVLPHGKFNCSPKHKPEWLDDVDVSIWHFHGDSNLRPEKSQRGFELWWPEFQKVLRADVGGIRDWLGEIQNGYLTGAITLHGTGVGAPEGVLYKNSTG
jgi:hypothetical protein